MKQVLVALLLLSSMAVNAQKKVIKYSNITSVGLLSGSSQNAFTCQTINGIKLDKWRFGVGVGLDNYGTKSIPVFVDVRRSFGNKKWQPLAYADVGIDNPLYWGNFNVKIYDNERMFHFNNKFYGEAGIGVAKKLSHKLSLNITVGFSYKHLSYQEKNIYSYYMYTLPTPEYQFDFYYKRLSLKVGLQF